MKILFPPSLSTIKLPILVQSNGTAIGTFSAHMSFYHLSQLLDVAAMKFKALVGHLIQSYTHFSKNKLSFLSSSLECEVF